MKLNRILFLLAVVTVLVGTGCTPDKSDSTQTMPSNSGASTPTKNGVPVPAQDAMKNAPGAGK